MQKRIIELMKKQGLNTKDEILVATITIIYVQAQLDQLNKKL